MSSEKFKFLVSLALRAPGYGKRERMGHPAQHRSNGKRDGGADGRGEKSLGNF